MMNLPKGSGAWSSQEGHTLELPVVLATSTELRVFESIADARSARTEAGGCILIWELIEDGQYGYSTL